MNKHVPKGSWGAQTFRWNGWTCFCTRSSAEDDKTNAESGRPEREHIKLLWTESIQAQQTMKGEWPQWKITNSMEPTSVDFAIEIGSQIKGYQLGFVQMEWKCCGIFESIEASSYFVGIRLEKLGQKPMKNSARQKA